MDKILKALIEKDEKILLRRDDLIAELDKEVPAALRRDYVSIRKAITLNVAEILAMGKADLNAAKLESKEILKKSGMQEARINFVLETFEKVLAAPKKNLDLEPSPQSEKKEDVEPEPAPKPPFRIVNPPPVENIQPPKVVIPPPPVQPVKPEPPKVVIPPPPEPTPVSSSDNGGMGKKLLIAAVLGLTVGVFFAMKNDSTPPPAQIESNVESPQPVQEKPPPQPVTPPVQEKFRDAKTELSLDGMDLGISLNDVRKNLGTENSAENKDGRTRYYYDNLEVAMKDGKVDAFVTYDPKYKTLRGLHVGSTYSEVVDAYGSNSKNMELGDLMLYEYPFRSLDKHEGLLRFAVNKSNNRVQYISVRILEPEPPKEEAKPENKPQPKEEAKPKPKEENKPKTEPKTNAKEDIIKAAANAFVAYHNAITDKDFQSAYNLMTEKRKKIMGNGMADFRKGYESTVSSEITDLQLVSSSADNVVMNYVLESQDRGKNEVIYRKFNGQVEMIKVGGEWKINEVHSTKVEELHKNK